MSVEAPAPAEEAPAEKEAPAAEPVHQGPAACPMLSKLYGSKRPPMHIGDGVHLSAVVAGCWPSEDPEVLLKQNWVRQPAETEGPAPPAFDPTAPEYTVLPERLAKSTALGQVNRLKKELKTAEVEMEHTGKKTPEAEKEAIQARIDEAKGKYDEAMAAFTELKASFAEDPTSLVTWMSSLFALADMGVTTFTVAHDFWPHCDLMKVFSATDGVELTSGIERMLAVFKKRYELERGRDSIQLLHRLSPNVFSGVPDAEKVAAAVTRLMEVQGLDPEASPAGCLDGVELVWWDSSAGSPVTVLKELAKMCVDETETDPDSGEVTVTVAKKIRALGVRGFSAKDLQAAVAAGVPIHTAHCEFAAHTTAAADLVAACRTHGITVLAEGGTMCGLLDASFLGAPPPSPSASDPRLPSAADAAALVRACGGWPQVQSALAAVKKVADRHGVTMQAVGLQWQMDAGTVPVVPTGWGADVAAPFGCSAGVSAPAADAKLFQAESFLDENDAQVLAALF